MPKRFPISFKLHALDRLSGPLKKAGRSFGNLSEKVRKATNRFALMQKRTETLRRKLKQFGGAMRSIGSKMTVGLTAPIALFGRFAVQSAANFEQGMNKVQALTGASIPQMKLLGKEAKSLGIKTKFSAGEVTEAMSFLAMAGFNFDQVMGSTKDTLALAAAANVDLGVSADIVSNVLTGYRLKVKDLGTANDVLVNTFTSTNTSLEMLGASFRKVGPIAAGMKIPMGETAAAIGLLGNAGFQAEEAGTGLRNVLINIVKPSTAAKKALARLRIPKRELIDSKGNLKSITKLVELFSKSSANAADLVTVFGKRAGPIFGALLGQGIKKMRTQVEISKKTGTTARIAAVQMKGFNGAVKALKSALEGLGIAIAQSGMLEFLTKAVKKMTAWVREFAKANPLTLKWVSILGAVTAILGPLLIALGGLISMLPFLKAGLVIIGGAIGAISLPVAAAIAAIAALVAFSWAVVANWDEISADLKRLWLVIEELAFDIWWGLAKFFGAIWDVISVVARSKWEGFKQMFIDIWSGIVGFFEAHGGKLLTLLGVIMFPIPTLIMKSWDLLPDAVHDMWEKIKNVFRDGIKFIMEKIPAIGDFLPDFIKTRLGVEASATGADSARQRRDRAFTPEFGLERTVNTETTSKSESKVVLDFKNIPKGTQVTGPVRQENVDLNLGFQAMGAF